MNRIRHDKKFRNSDASSLNRLSCYAASPMAVEKCSVARGRIQSSGGSKRQTNSFFYAMPETWLTSALARSQLPRESCYRLSAMQKPEDKVKRAKIYGLVESEEFAFSKALIGDPIEVDTELEGLFRRIEDKPHASAVVLHPDVRMEVTKGLARSIAVFFRVMPKHEQVELLWSALKEN